tara:strand:- start:65 stop:574 length:510 start_codon:yes stop_codon:yes gene_type:complete
MGMSWEDEYNSKYGLPNLSSSNSNQIQDFNNLGGLNLPSNYNFGNQNSMENNGIGERFATDNLAKLKLDPQSSYFTGGGEPTGMGKYLNKDFLGGAGSALQGLGSLASGWAAMKNLKLTRQAMDTQQDQWNKNYGSQVITTNNQIDNQNAWKKAQGRTDFGKRVGTQQY